MLNFDQWLLKVDSLLALQYYGMTSGDLEDYCWFDLFADKLTPEEAVEAYVEDTERSWLGGENYGHF